MFYIDYKSCFGVNTYESIRLLLSCLFLNTTNVISSNPILSKVKTHYHARTKIMFVKNYLAAWLHEKENIMKKLLLGLTLLSSMSTFASNAEELIATVNTSCLNVEYSHVASYDDYKVCMQAGVSSIVAKLPANKVIASLCQSDVTGNISWIDKCYEEVTPNTFFKNLDKAKSACSEIERGDHMLGTSIADVVNSDKYRDCMFKNY